MHSGNYQASQTHPPSAARVTGKLRPGGGGDEPCGGGDSVGGGLSPGGGLPGGDSVGGGLSPGGGLPVSEHPVHLGVGCMKYLSYGTTQSMEASAEPDAVIA